MSLFSALHRHLRPAKVDGPSFAALVQVEMESGVFSRPAQVKRLSNSPSKLAHSLYTCDLLDRRIRALNTHSNALSEIARLSPLGMGLVLTVHVAQSSFTFPHLSPLFPKGAAKRSFTARIEGAHSDRAASASKKDRLAAPCPPLTSPPRCATNPLYNGWALRWVLP